HSTLPIKRNGQENIDKNSDEMPGNRASFRPIFDEFCPGTTTEFCSPPHDQPANQFSLSSDGRVVGGDHLKNKDGLS
ncbi:hypothetical protein HAX54_004078, partial [Datura stramonium]|nr:hypothetical protein [Datura stramonium]